MSSGPFWTFWQRDALTVVRNLFTLATDPNYGARLDGSDASVGINKAIIAANAKGGDTVYLPAGNYTIQNPFVNLGGSFANITLAGAGIGATNLIAGSSYPAGIPMFGGVAGVNLRLRDLTAVGRSLATGYNAGEVFLAASSCDTVRLDRVEIMHFGGGGVAFQSSNRVAIRDCPIHDTEGEAIGLFGFCDHNLVRGNYVYGNGDTGIDLNGSYNIVEANHVYNNGAANGADGRAGFGITVEGDAGLQPTGNVLAANSVIGNTLGGINISCDGGVGSANVGTAVLGGYVLNNASTGRVSGNGYGIGIGSGSSAIPVLGVIIDGVFIAGNGSVGGMFPDGIWCSAVQDSSIRAVCRFNHAYGVEFDTGAFTPVNVAVDVVYAGNGSANSHNLSGNADRVQNTSFSQTHGQARFDMPDGGLLPPRITTTQKNALTLEDGIIIYDTTLGQFQVRQAGAWIRMSVA